MDQVAKVSMLIDDVLKAFNTIPISEIDTLDSDPIPHKDLLSCCKVSGFLHSATIWIKG